jgi:hypothetical protein
MNDASYAPMQILFGHLSGKLTYLLHSHEHLALEDDR